MIREIEAVLRIPEVTVDVIVSTVIVPPPRCDIIMAVIIEKATFEIDWSYASINIEVSISTRALDVRKTLMTAE